MKISSIEHTFFTSSCPNQVILRDTRTPGEFVFFIKSGQCNVVREMVLVRREPAVGKKRLILPPVGADNKIDPLFNVKTHDQVKKYFLVIARLGEGDYFGVGEDLTKMSIISVKKVGTLYPFTHTTFTFLLLPTQTYLGLCHAFLVGQEIVTNSLESVRGRLTFSFHGFKRLPRKLGKLCFR